jgi:chemotaxis protein methyltransferase CheR
MPASARAASANASASPADDHLSDWEFNRLAALIEDYSGIKMPATKRTMLEGRLRRRMRANAIATLDDYCAFLFDRNGLDSEFVHLINAVTTNKTDFFREPAHFRFLETTGLPELARAGRPTIKAWSAACSIGAEAYTLAMVLEENLRAGSRQDYSILCTDLSTDVLQQAISGKFDESMIEPISLELRQRYVMRSKTAGAGQVRMAAALRSKLIFARLNLMDQSYPVPTDMDVIFCRNILIYFDKPTQAKVLRRLCAHLRHGGYLFLGHSESTSGIDLPVTQVSNTVFQRTA